MRFNSVARGTPGNRPPSDNLQFYGQLDIDPTIDKSLSSDWPVGRIDATLRAILRAAAFELLRRRDIPQGVVISEYVDIAKAFYEDDAPRLVNAVLDNIARQVAE